MAAVFCRCWPGNAGWLLSHQRQQKPEPCAYSTGEKGRGHIVLQKLMRPESSNWQTGAFMIEIGKPHKLRNSERPDSNSSTTHRLQKLQSNERPDLNSSVLTSATD